MPRDLDAVIVQVSYQAAVRHLPDGLQGRSVWRVPSLSPAPGTRVFSVLPAGQTSAGGPAWPARQGVRWRAQEPGLRLGFLRETAQLTGQLRRVYKGG